MLGNMWAGLALLLAVEISRKSISKKHHPYGKNYSGG